MQEDQRIEISMVHVLIVACVAIFVGMIFSGGNFFFSNELLMRFGARSNFEIVNGQYYRLLQSALIHSGATHLIANMISMKVVGDIVEAVFGKINFVLIAFFSAVFGNIASFAFSSGSISVGASGIVFGLMGAHLAMFVTNREKYKQYIGLDLLIFLGINTVIGIWDPTIDEFAHMGGLIGGFVTSMILIKFSKTKLLSYALVVILMVVLSVSSFSLGRNHYMNSGDYAFDNIIDLIEKKKYYEAEVQLMEAKHQFPDNARIEKLFALIYLDEK